jgi:hypothetical protein
MVTDKITVIDKGPMCHVEEWKSSKVAREAGETLVCWFAPLKLCAVSEWTKKTRHFGDSNGEQCSLQMLCGVVGIPYNTLMKFVSNKKTINREVGRGVGRDCLIGANNQKVITDIMVRKDHTNEGMTMTEGVDLILEVLPQLSWEQSHQSFLRTIRQKH